MAQTPKSKAPSCEQLEDRLLALHKASLELVQEISLETLLEKIAAIACEQVHARYAAVGVLDINGKLEQFIPVGMTHKEISQMPHPPEGKGLIGALMKTSQTIRLENIAQDPRKSGFPQHHPEMTTFLGVPIRKGNQNLGQIYLTNKSGGASFTDDDQRIIEVLAAYASVAISNARLYKELKEHEQALERRTENLALLNQLATTLDSTMDFDKILENALNQVMGYLNIEVGEIYLRQEDSNTLRRMHHHGKLVDKIFLKDTVQVGQGMVGGVAKTNQVRTALLPTKDLRDLNKELEEKCFHQVACFPLTGRKGSVGVLVVATCQPHPLDELEVQFLTAISSWVGTAIDNMRLSLQGKRLAILEERERIGMDLHDGIIQSIYAVGLTLEHARMLLHEDPNQSTVLIDQAISDLNKSIRDIRAYILDLRPRKLYDEGLMAGIQRLIHEFRANTLLEVNLQAPPEGLEKLPEASALALFHICQEALGNIAKHAHAQHVSIVVWTTRDRVLLEVHDDGRGFDVAKMKTTIGHGLSNMQTRAHNVAGDVDITSDIDAGTTVLAWVPRSHKKQSYVAE